MAEKCEKCENGKSVKLTKDYRIEIQTEHDIKNNKIKLMAFIRDCDTGAGPSKCKCMKKSFIKRGRCCTSSESRGNISSWFHVCTESQVCWKIWD
jgi:hypothetical protein